jgi:hypothetical protein
MDDVTYFVPSEDEVEEQPRPEGFDSEEAQNLVTEMAEEAVDWREQYYDPFLEDATKYYKGELPEPAQDDRSSIVSTDVRDAIRSTMPSLMRVFFGPENVVEFLGRGREDQPVARQQTDMANVVVREDNQGFMIFYSWFKDALKNRLGTVKWWQESEHLVKREAFEALTLAEIGAITDVLAQTPGVTDVEIETSHEYVDGEGEEVYDVMVKYVSIEGRVRFDTVPAEEMIWSPSARSKADAMLLGHVRDVPGDFLTDMDDLDQDIVSMQIGSAQESRLRSDVDAARRIDKGEHPIEDARDEATRLTQYAELYIRADLDEDEIGELRLFKCVGQDWTIANGDGAGELVDEIPFAFLSPEPEPHSFLGWSMTDITKDIQRIKSFVTRATLDSLAHAIDPVTEVVSNEVNMKDVMSRKLSRVIRARKPGMVREVPHRWVGGEALEMLAYLDSMKEDRTGRGKAAAGLDPAVLQSSTKAAVNASVQGSQQQLELIARIFAETGVADLYKGILRLLVKHQDENRRRVVRLRGDYVAMDPSKWDATMDVQVNVALGSGLVEDKINTLSLIYQNQLELMQLSAPIVTWRGVRTTLSKMVELGGWPTADEFYEPWGEQQQIAWDQQQAQNQQPDPQTMLVQIEGQRLQLEAEEISAKMALDERKLMLEDDRERDKMARQFAVDSEKLRIEAEGAAEDRRIQALVEADRTAQDADVRREEAQRAVEAAQAGAAAPAEGGSQGGA